MSPPRRSVRCFVPARQSFSCTRPGIRPALPVRQSSTKHPMPWVNQERLMNTKPLGWLVIFGLIYANALTAQPLEDLQARLAELRSEKPIKVKVDVEIRHRESAPLHLDR